MEAFRKVFRSRQSVIAMIHILPLPGTPFHSGSMQKIIDQACTEADTYLKHDIDGILIENMHDVPYVQARHFEPETVAAMTRVATEIRRIAPKPKPLGVQILACGNREALAVAQSADLDFIRAEGFVFGHVADEGYTDAQAGQMLRYRRKIGAEHILIFTDIKKKHSAHSITSDVSLVETAHAAVFFRTDGIVLTGSATAAPADVTELNKLASAVHCPILIGSGVTAANIYQYHQAHALIVGSEFKRNGHWANGLDTERIARFMDKFRKADSC